MIQIMWTIATTSGPIVGQAIGQTIGQAVGRMAVAVRKGYGDQYGPAHERALARFVLDINRRAPLELPRTGRFVWSSPAVAVELTVKPVGPSAP